MMQMQQKKASANSDAASVPLISVVMPAYNAEKTIRQAVESVLNQTWRNLELIVVDNHSADSTPQILGQISDPRLRVLSQDKNIRAGGARNAGTAAAAGKWIAFLDSDDAWEPEKLERQLGILEKYPDARLMYTGSAFMDENGARLSYTLDVPVRLSKTDILKQNLISCSSVLVEKELFEQYPMPQKPMLHEDFASWIGILSEIPYAYGLNEPLLIYRVTKTSQSGNKIKAAKMNWNTYRYAGLGIPARIRYMASYTVRGLMKYSKLKKSTKKGEA